MDRPTENEGTRRLLADIAAAKPASAIEIKDRLARAIAKLDLAALLVADARKIITERL